LGVVVSNLTKRFTHGGLPAVAGVSFSAREGSITTLLGPSGSGKSTVLRLIAGLEYPDSGTIHFNEADYTRLPVQKRQIGFVFQSYALFKHMTVRDNIRFGLSVRHHPRPQADQRVAELMALVQLEGLGERYPAQLSGGQRQRVAFARALAIHPRILLLDEPFGALDAKVRVELRMWLKQFHESAHVTTILVTHDQEEAMELSEHVVVMQQGRVEQAGSPREIYDRPATPFVAEFVGGANVLSGRVQNGRAAVSSLNVQAPPAVPEGANVQAFVRPHDVKLEKAADDVDHVSVGRVEKIVIVGGQAKVTVCLADGTPVTVQMRRVEIEMIGIREGDRVMVDLREAKVFIDDYSI
jgi:sulfate/thiosulfate transport system ATP-binding protein